MIGAALLSLSSLVLLAPADGGVLLARPVALGAEHLEGFVKENRAQYRGKAWARRDTLNVTCDLMDVFMSPRGDVLRVVAKGNVVAIDGDREARGDEAEFLNETGLLTVKGHPWGRQGGREVDGEVVTFVTGVDRLTVTRAHTRVKETAGQPDQKLTIDADLLTFEGPKNEARWTGHVKAVKGKTTLLTPDLLAISAPGGDVTRVKASGGAEVIEPTRWARGQFADYDVEAGKLVVTGNPQARDGKVRMKGTRVTFLSGTEFLEVENATTVITPDEPQKKKGH